MARILGFGRSKVSPRTFKERGEKAVMALRDMFRGKGRRIAAPPGSTAPAPSPPEASTSKQNKQRHGGAHQPHRVRFRHQRAIAIFLVLGLVTLFCSSVLWWHYDKIIENTTYNFFAKLGLAVIDITAIIFGIWHVYAHWGGTKVWCYISEIIITITMVLHAGAVLQWESSGIQEKETIKTVGSAAAEIAAAETKARIDAAAQQAAILNQMGQHKTAGKLVAEAARGGSNRGDDGGVVKDLRGKLQEHKQTTFLPEWYMKGGMYYVPILISLALFFITIGVSAFGVKYEDANHDGVPDYLQEPGRESELMAYLTAMYPGGVPVHLLPANLQPRYVERPRIGLRPAAVHQDTETTGGASSPKA